MLKWYSRSNIENRDFEKWELLHHGKNSRALRRAAILGHRINDLSPARNVVVYMQLFSCSSRIYYIIKSFAIRRIRNLLQSFASLFNTNYIFFLKGTKVWDRWVAVHIGKKYAPYCQCRHVVFCRDSPLAISIHFISYFNLGRYLAFLHGIQSVVRNRHDRN